MPSNPSASVPAAAIGSERGGGKEARARAKNCSFRHSLLFPLAAMGARRGTLWGKKPTRRERVIEYRQRVGEACVCVCVFERARERSRVQSGAAASSSPAGARQLRRLKAPPLIPFSLPPCIPHTSRARSTTTPRGPFVLPPHTSDRTQHTEKQTGARAQAKTEQPHVRRAAPPTRSTTTTMRRSAAQLCRMAGTTQTESARRATESERQRERESETQPAHTPIWGVCFSLSPVSLSPSRPPCLPPAPSSTSIRPGSPPRGGGWGAWRKERGTM